MSYFYAILAAVVIYMVIGFLWYSPMLFGKVWHQHFGKPEGSKIFWAFLGAILVSSIVSIFFYALLSQLDVTDFMSGIKVGFMAWLGFVATTQFSGVIWAKQPFKIYLINQGAFLVSFSLMAGTLAYLM